jgi:colanic acid/amylovoran biosynthesis glycosyltransferase
MTVLPLARRARKPLAVTVHGYDATNTSLVQDPRYLAGVERLVGYGTVFVAVSRFIAGRLTALGVPDVLIRQRYIGVEIPKEEPAPSERDGVLFVGRLVEKKGTLDLLEAMSDPRLQARRLTIVGDGPLRERLEREVAARRLDVRFAGALPPEGVAAEMTRAAVLCVPSRRSPEGDSEGFGMVFAEAAARHLPSVSYRHGGIPEAVSDEETGLLAAEGDVRGLADRLQRLLSDPNLARQFGRRARDRVVQEFDISALTRGLEEVYDEMTAASGGAVDPRVEPSSKRH